MHTLGPTFMPPGFHAGGLRYHGMAPLVSHLQRLGLDRGARLPPDRGASRRASASRAPRASCRRPRRTTPSRRAIDEALRCKEEGESETILFNLCGHGHFDMQAYIDYFAGKLEDREYDEGDLAMALAGLPPVAA